MFGWFRNKKKEKWLKSSIALAKSGDIVFIEEKYTNKVTKCMVNSNCPEEGKIFLAVDYNKEKHTCWEHKVFLYDDPELSNFKAMNLSGSVRSSQSDIIGLLRLNLKQAVDKEEYEQAEKYRKAIEILEF